MLNKEDLIKYIQENINSFEYSIKSLNEEQKNYLYEDGHPKIFSSERIISKFPGLLCFFKNVYMDKLFESTDEFFNSNTFNKIFLEGKYTYLENYLIIPLQSKVRQRIAKKRFIKQRICNELKYLPPKTNFVGGRNFQLCKTSFDSFVTQGER